jgi:hypothetical protein
MRMLRSGLVLLLVLLLVPTVHGQASRTVSRTFDLASGGTVTLESYKGRIDVQTWDREQARVEVQIESDEQSAVEQTNIRFESENDRLDIETDYDELEDGQKLFGLFRLGSIDRPSTNYTLTVPRTSNLTVDTYSAATTVTDLNGDLRVDAYSAALTVNRLTGTLRADTYSGDVTVTGLDGALRGDTYSGTLRADSLSGRVAFSTYSGSATLGFAALTGDCRFDSFSGDVTVTLPASAGAVVETEEGALDSDLPLRIERVGDDRIRGTLGDGGPRLRFDTFSGTLSVRAR